MNCKVVLNFFGLVPILFFVLSLFPDRDSFITNACSNTLSSNFLDTNRQKKCGDLDSVMYSYLFIIVKKDSEKFLGYFSKDQTFKFSTYLSGKKKKPADFLEVKYKKLRFDIENRIGLYNDFFESDPDDYNYRASIMESPFEKWKRDNNSYKIEDDWNIYFVKWKLEGDIWVIEEISYTQPY